VRQHSDKIRRFDMAAAKKDEITFETAITRLEELTNQLESGTLTLDESVKVFEEGIKLSKFCENKLQNIEQRITVIENSDYVEPEIEESPSSDSETEKKSKKIKKNEDDDDDDGGTLF
jgi:exodeoxyribonuclease VII small subunit